MKKYRPILSVLVAVRHAACATPLPDVAPGGCKAFPGTASVSSRLFYISLQNQSPSSDIRVWHPEDNLGVDQCRMHVSD